MFNYPLTPGRRWRTEEFNHKMKSPPKIPGAKYHRTCPYCGDQYKTGNADQKYCSKSCNHKASQGNTRRGKNGWKSLNLRGPE